MTAVTRDGQTVVDDDTVVETARAIVTLLLRDYRGPVGVSLGNGRPLHRWGKIRAVLVFRDAGVIRDLVLRHNLVRLAEYYLAGDVAVEGDVEALFDLVGFLQNSPPTLATRSRLAWLAFKLPASPLPESIEPLRHDASQRSNTLQAIAHHYDVGNDFYRMWLDPEMVYSCAYFAHARQSLADAQRDKLDYICRKLRLRPGDTLLDIGCGWGALARWAARHYGARVCGITLSEQQHRYAVEQVRHQGLEDNVTIELCDYRELDERRRFDRIVSVGMFEHIGIDNFPVYFGKLRRLLKHDGLFLNHGITNDTGWQETPVTRFVNRYVFPDGELTRISVVCAAMEEAGFEPLDVESLRRHYVLTLRNWIRSLEQNRQQIIKLTSEPIYRLWRLYMAGAAYYFNEGSINVYQVLAAHRGGELKIPLRRDDLYGVATQRGRALQGARDSRRSARIAAAR